MDVRIKSFGIFGQCWCSDVFRISQSICRNLMIDRWNAWGTRIWFGVRDPTTKHWLDGFHPNLSELNIFNFEMPVLINYWIVYIIYIYDSCPQNHFHRFLPHYFCGWEPPHFAGVRDILRAVPFTLANQIIALRWAQPSPRWWFLISQILKTLNDLGQFIGAECSRMLQMCFSPCLPRKTPHPHVIFPRNRRLQTSPAPRQILTGHSAWIDQRLGTEICRSCRRTWSWKPYKIGENTMKKWTKNELMGFYGEAMGYIYI